MRLSSMVGAAISPRGTNGLPNQVTRGFSVQCYMANPKLIVTISWYKKMVLIGYRHKLEVSQSLLPLHYTQSKI